MDETLKAAVQETAQHIYDEKGEVSPSDLIAAATPKDSPAHEAFEWNNKKAGDEYRLIQSRRWLRVVTIKTERVEQPERMVHVPAIRTADSESKEGAYKPMSVVVENIDEFERALDEASQRLHAARRAVEELRDLAEKSDKPERAAMVAQVSRALDIMQQAIQSVH